MKQLWNKTTAVVAATLLVGMALGFGLNAMTDSGSASSAPVAEQKGEKVEKTEKRSTDMTSSLRNDEWDPFAEMERMQEEIDRAIRRATEQFRLGPSPGFARENRLGYSAKLDLRDRKDHFEIRAWMPDAEAADVNVTTEGDNLLRVAVTHRKQNKNESGERVSSVTELGRYEQLVTLPEPVNADELKVERKDRELVITVPKARAS